MDDLAIQGMEMPKLLRAAPKKKQRKKVFQTKWVKLPWRWAKALQQSKSASTYRLALVILFEAFKHEHAGGEIVLSAKVTKMPRNTRKRATRELVRLGLIKVKRDDGQAFRVVKIL